MLGVRPERGAAAGPAGSPGVGGPEAETGGPERAVRCLTGGAGGRGRLPDAVGVGRGSAADRRGGAGPGAGSGGDAGGGGGDGGGGGAVAEVPDGAATSSPSCDPWTPQGC